MKCFLKPIIPQILFSLCIYFSLGDVMYGVGKENKTAQNGTFTNWQQSILDVPCQWKAATMQLLRQDYSNLEIDKSCNQTDLVIGSLTFSHGLGTHSQSYIKIYSPDPIERFFSWVGVNNVNNTEGSVRFLVSTDEDGEVYNSGILKAGQEAKAADVNINNRNTIYLEVDNAGDSCAYDHANWADALIMLKGGKTLKVSDLAQIEISYYPFHFIYNGQNSDELLPEWKHAKTVKEISDNKKLHEYQWTDPKTKLKVIWQVISYSDFPALDWLLFFENEGDADSAIIQDVQVMNLILADPISNSIPYRLHSINGGIFDPTYYEPSITVLENKNSKVLEAASGRPSTKNSPFFKLEAGKSSIVGALEWPGNWKATFKSDKSLIKAQAGMAKTHFLLHPSEKVGSPRVLLLNWEGDTLESNAQFRQLIYKHYVPKKDGSPRLPTPFCNTCFTRGGGWLNETTADNQISLIEVYSNLGLEAIMTDAGWFDRGWPDGAGNYTPRKDNYPDGMAPVAAAAKENGIIYGLWFEPERVVNGTDFHIEHPEWVLGCLDEGYQHHYLANFGLPEVQEHFFNIVKSFMELPGFRVYRQDFNMDPLPYWHHNDTPDRQGITEIKYAQGLYAYWDKIRTTWPDVLMEECASGGHRITLGTIKRFDFHQKSDMWWDNESDQASLWSLSQYVPNNTIASHISMYNSPNLDDYSSHSTMASSLCFAWIADAPGFDTKRAKELIDRYKEVRHLLVGAWYPLLPYNYYYHDFPSYEQDPLSWGHATPAQRANRSHPRDGWIGSQYHRPDLDEGMLLVFRHGESPCRTVEVDLRAIDSNATYNVTSDRNKTKKEIKGSDLAKGFLVTLEEPKSSDLIVYKKISK